MNISSEIERISVNIAECYAWAQERGAIMPETQTSDNLLTTLQTLGDTVLYENTDGNNTSDTITLSDDVTNYSYIEVIYGISDSVSSARASVGQTVAMSITQSDTDCFKITTGTATLSGTKLTRGAEGTERQLIINHATEGQLDFSGSTPDSGYYIRIYRVIGYK